MVAKITKEPKQRKQKNKDEPMKPPSPPSRSGIKQALRMKCNTIIHYEATKNKVSVHVTTPFSFGTHSRPFSSHSVFADKVTTPIF